MLMVNLPYKLRILAAVVMTAVFLSACQAGPTTGPTERNTDRLQVIASFYLMADFAEKIGGDLIEVTNLVPSGVEPHEWEPATTDMTLLEQADMLIYNGAGMEHWIDSVKAALDNKDLLLVETAAAIDMEPADAGLSDLQDSDPHVWLSPLNAKKQLQTILEALVQADPKNQDRFQANYDHWAAEMDKLDQEFRTGLAALTNRDIIVAHQAFGYLCAEYDLVQVAIEGLMADSEPDPARMAEIVSFARDHEVSVIFFEELASQKVADTIAREIGARTAVLNPLEGLTDDQLAAGADYFSIMRENLATLVDALS